MSARAPLLLVLGLLPAACGGDVDPRTDGGRSAAGLVDVTAAAGLDFVHDSGFRGSYYFPETFGSGVALVDLDGDGALDLYALQSGVLPDAFPADGAAPEPRPVNRIWAGRGDGTFVERTQESGDAAHDGFDMGVCAGDVDGDGLADLFVTSYGPDALLRNRGELRFEDAAAGTPLADERWTTACGFADLDRDGDLDLFVTGYVRWNLLVHRDCRDYCDVSLFSGIGDRVYRGDGSGGFEERTREWGLGPPRGADGHGKGLGLALVDLDDDGDVDAYVANDTTPNHTWLNRGDGSLEDATFLSGAALSVDGRPEAGMGVAVGDADGDGLPDLHVTNFQGEANALYSADGTGRFRDRARQAALVAPSRSLLGFGTAFVDLDRDGLEDLVVTNGHVLREIAGRTPGVTWAQPGLVLHAKPNGRFDAWDAGPAFAAPRVGRGLAVGDVDGDGAPDVVVTGSDEPLVLFANRLALPGSSWLRVELAGGGTNTLAIGARVTLALDGAERAQVRWVRSGTGYLSQDDPRPLFGIPPGAVAGTLSVRWPDGADTEQRVETFGRVVRLARH